jgi:hypothetical protein
VGLVGVIVTELLLAETEVTLGIQVYVEVPPLLAVKVVVAFEQTVLPPIAVIIRGAGVYTGNDNGVAVLSIHPFPSVTETEYVVGFAVGVTTILGVLVTAPVLHV